MSDKILVSVIIPVYNVEIYIEKCLRSVLGNSFIEHCEVILVNDASTDGSMAVVETVLREFPQVRDKVVLRSHDSNRGSAAARNTGLLQAHGEYIICVDSDDWVEPNYLEALYTEAVTHDADIVGCDIQIHNPNESHVRPCPLAETGTACLMGLLEGSIQGWLHIKLLKRNLFTEHSLFWIEGINICEDLLIMVKLFSVARRVCHLDTALYHYNRLNVGSYTHAKLSESKICQIIQANSELTGYLERNNLLEPNWVSLLALYSRTKIWICLDAEKLTSKHMALYNEYTLSAVTSLPLKIRFLHLLCQRKLFALVKFILISNRFHRRGL